MTITAPGRICLFGDHQDYLELPVIACAIDRQVTLCAKANDENVFRLDMPDIGKTRTFNVFEVFDSFEKGDHLASSIKVVRRYGCIPDRGYDITLTSTVPINAGVSSSSAVVVAWIHFLLKAYGCDHEVTPAFLARLAYEAEVIEHHSPGGRMDQYTSAIGGIIYIDTSKSEAFSKINHPIDGMILGESGIPKQTVGVLGDLRGKALAAVNEVKKALPDFDLEKATIETRSEHLKLVSDDLKPFFYAAIENHRVTKEAMKAFQKETLDLKTIGVLMNAHHKVLKESLGVTVPLIDTMIDAALEAGAYGAKIVGSGGGGSIVAIAPENKKEEVINAILKSGAKGAYEVKVSHGTQVS